MKRRLSYRPNEVREGAKTECNDDSMTRRALLDMRNVEIIRSEAEDNRESEAMDQCEDVFLSFSFHISFYTSDCDFIP